MESILDTSQARSAKDFANGQINTFIENVEDLTHALKNVDTPEIARVKAKVKIALSDGASQVRTQARQVSMTTDTYVHDNPWQVVGIAALIGLAMGIMVTR